MIAAQEKTPASGGWTGAKTSLKGTAPHHESERDTSVPGAQAGNDLDFPASKVFSTLQARYALLGHALHRTVAADGTMTLRVERWGQLRYLHTVEDAEAFIRQVEGG